MLRNIGLLVIVGLFGMVSNAVAQDVVAANLAVASSVAAVSSGIASAASGITATSSVAAASAMDKNDWTGDHLQIKSNLYGLKKLCDTPKKDACGNQCDKKCDSTIYFAPAYVRFDVSRGNTEETVVITPRDNFAPKDISENDNHRADANHRPDKNCTSFKSPSANKDNTCQIISVRPWKEHGIYGWLFSNGSPLHLNFGGDDNWEIGTPVDTAVPANSQSVHPYDAYVVNKSDIENISYVKYGWTYGALAVPFKYQRDAKTISFAPSYQLYLGYKRDSNGTAEGPFLSAGFTTADIPTGAGTSSNKQAFSYGGGWIFEIKKDKGLQLLIMAGQDKFGAGSGYAYENDTWYSVSLGFSLDPLTNK